MEGKRIFIIRAPKDNLLLLLLLLLIIVVVVIQAQGNLNRKDNDDYRSAGVTAEYMGG